jgi:hypothetical protein
MSMNVYISAKREIVTVKSGIKDTQYIRFNAWQTPTDVTYKIVNSENQQESYIEWVMQQSDDYAEEHVKDLIEWINDCVSKDYLVEFTVI